MTPTQIDTEIGHITRQLAKSIVEQGTDHLHENVDHANRRFHALLRRAVREAVEAQINAAARDGR